MAGEEVAPIGRMVDVTINKQDDDKRNPFAILSEERQAEKWSNMGLLNDFKDAKTQEEMTESDHFCPCFYILTLEYLGNYVPDFEPYLSLISQSAFFLNMKKPPNNLF